MKYYCTPIVVNTQGLKQKNFDPRNKEEHDKATSYKTKHEYNLLKSQVQLILDAYKNGDEEATLYGSIYYAPGIDDFNGIQ